MSIAGCSDVWIGHFSLKYPSLLSFDRASRNDKTVKHNLKKLFGVRATPLRHGDAGAIGQSGSVSAPQCVQEGVRVLAAEQGSGAIHLFGALSVVFGRDRLLFLFNSALRSMLREASPG